MNIKFNVVSFFQSRINTERNLYQLHVLIVLYKFSKTKRTRIKYFMFAQKLKQVNAALEKVTYGRLFQR